ncbi:intradiol ring-cleavage dioxygenase [Paludisphaera borealis]|uniref:Protocatechuate 3,4-dioxygenase beta chain n=1 Tax=Paludisphaera borealis TaxID=1387353 RepID=A0A1U7CID5_9BACT|nr:intradiol ring-cleavage dioxygenase [Paludisphaera borealis]APW58666.1 Protocatechuate 3,4-dioxygenase beta chain [Paludisphaera borealis]
MSTHFFKSNRRHFLGALALGASSAFTVRGAFAEELTRTPTTNEGPFFPNKLPLDTDNDLLIINDAITPAVGEVTHLSGRLLDAKGAPLRNAVIEIWQCDRDGIYLKQHTRDGDPFDTNFQGYGRFLTSSTGEYYFRTIKPVPYHGRPAAHIHARIWKGDKKLLTTECFIKGSPKNEQDGQFKQIRARDPKGHETLCLDFAAIKGSKIGELAAKWDIVLGYSPEA